MKYNVLLCVMFVPFVSHAMMPTPGATPTVNGTTSMAQQRDHLTRFESKLVTGNNQGVPHNNQGVGIGNGVPQKIRRKG